ncbi:putative paraquat-inducible protein A [Gynuella sunshinyii YC6258]|uniref:Putative paraquat-inducible protein A n=2 Tax=Gynuella sunshinyii TaxID=1445505 RepID=A0A0C5VR36_9GAMM|nr:putative paraquat-inducible protein A [Gynuella sunshinyii YC6258]
MLYKAEQLNLVGCHVCGLVSEAGAIGKRCPRCHSPLHRRKHNSLVHTWALLVAAMALYIPANIQPVMYTQMLGSRTESTIMAGIMEFWKLGSWDIAVIIFIASVVVPCFKFIVLITLSVSVKLHSAWAMRERAKLYRITEFIGYWSMLDVVVVALVSALVKFKALSDIEPRMGILYFGLVVILTMLSAMSFDPRLIWDYKEHNESGQR